MTWLVNDIPDADLETAEQIRQTAETAYNRYRSDGRLTPDAIRNLISAAYQQADQKMALLQATTTDQAQNTRDRAMKTAFGTAGSDPVTIVAARDAADRAAQLAPDDWRQALALLDQADLNGDESLARAVAHRAWELGSNGDGTWDEVLNKFVSGRPDVAQALNQLANARIKPTASQLFAFALPKPPEIASYSDWQIAAFAAQAA